MAEAASASLQASAERMRTRGKAAKEAGRSALDGIVEAYLNLEHMKKPEAGCTIGALLSDLARGVPMVREAAAGGAAQLVAAVEDALPQSLGLDRKPRAQAIVGMLAGCLQLARLEADPKAGDAILVAGRDAARRLASAPVG